MAKSCPDCGAEVAYSPRTVELFEGTCSSCGHAFVLAPPTAAPTDAERAATASATRPAECWDCGGSLEFSVRPNRVVEATCVDCETTTRLTAGRPPRADEEGESPGERRFEGEGARGPPRERRDAYRPSARPCRQCGAVLQFSQNPDGTVEGSCPSCGNRFTMRPKEEGSRGGYGRRPSFGGGFRRPPFRREGRRGFREERDDGEYRRRRRPRDDR